jgi:hypothetical protein
MVIELARRQAKGGEMVLDSELPGCSISLLTTSRGLADDLQSLG